MGSVCALMDVRRSSGCLRAPANPPGSTASALRVVLASCQGDHRSMSPRRLTICAVDTVPIRVPLARTFHGSHYRMTHRSTIVTRIRTEEGIVGQAYAGDEDTGLLEIERIIAEEITPRLLGEDAFAVERC